MFLRLCSRAPRIEIVRPSRTSFTRPSLTPSLTPFWRPGVLSELSNRSFMRNGHALLAEHSENARPSPVRAACHTQGKYREIAAELAAAAPAPPLRAAIAALYKGRALGTIDGGMMRFLCVVGTRPEAIKMAPVILELARHADVTTLVLRPAHQAGARAAAMVRHHAGRRHQGREIADAGDADRRHAPADGADDRQAPARCDRGAGRHDDGAGRGAHRVLCRRSVRACRGRPADRQTYARRFPRSSTALPPTAWRAGISARPAARSPICAARGSSRRGFISPAIPASTRFGWRLSASPAAAAGNRGRRRILLTAHRRENQGSRMESICRADHRAGAGIRRHRVCDSGASEPGGARHVRAAARRA